MNEYALELNLHSFTDFLVREKTETAVTADTSPLYFLNLRSCDVTP
jgi:hypothetical protein